MGLDHSRSRSEHKAFEGSMLQPTSVLDEIKQEISEYSRKSKEKVVLASQKHKKNSKASKISNRTSVIQSMEEQIDIPGKQQLEIGVEDKIGTKTPNIVNIKIENTHQALSSRAPTDKGASAELQIASMAQSQDVTKIVHKREHIKKNSYIQSNTNQSSIMNVQGTPHSQTSNECAHKMPTHQKFIRKHK